VTSNLFQLWALGYDKGVPLPIFVEAPLLFTTESPFFLFRAVTSGCFLRIEEPQLHPALAHFTDAGTGRISTLPLYLGDASWKPE